MDLIEENLGVKIEKKRKRIQMASSDEDGSDGGGARSGSDDDLPDPQRARYELLLECSMSKISTSCSIETQQIKNVISLEYVVNLLP